MKTVLADDFLLELGEQTEYIASDKILAAIAFEQGVFEAIENIKAHPMKCRKSIWFNDDNVRDLIFKGYTIIYKINWASQEIFVFSLLKDQQSPHQR